MVAYIMGGLSSMLTNSDALRTYYIHRLNVIKKELVEARVGNTLRKRVIGFYTYLVGIVCSGGVC